MNNSKAGCSQSKKKLQMNKDLLKIRLLYNKIALQSPFTPFYPNKINDKSLNGK